jgi:predicted peptidase
MKRILTTVFLFALTAVVTLQAGETKTGFVRKIHKDKDGDAKYVVFVPKDYGINDDQKVYPVILFLHGAGSTGDDGEKQAKGGLAKAIREKKENFPFIVVFPQAHTKGWNANGPSAKQALAILDEVQKDYKTDKKRVYLTGLSMGGFGTFSLAAAYPDRWAAIAPICGGGDPKTAAKFKDLPCWCFHGDADKTVSVEKSRAMIKALKDARGSPRFDEYPGIDHNSWDRAYGTAELYTWFLKHTSK